MARKKRGKSRSRSQPHAGAPGAVAVGARGETLAASSPAAARGAAEAAPKPSLWILDSWRDLALFVATPLLILPLFYLAAQRWSFEDIALFVAAFGALGHHFPGMVRAYGDRELFERFKTRFILAPAFLVAVCTLFAVNDMSGMVLIAAVWGVWHGLAQTYGFLRIYDAKKSSFAPLTAKLDFYMCIAWFGAGLLLSPTRMFDMLSRFYTNIGGPLLPGELFAGLRTVWAWGTAAITVAFVVNAVVAWRHGTPPSPIKILLMVTSFGFWWYTCVTIQSLLVGVALFEIFHDVQYLSIVWIFNRNRVEKASRTSGFLRFVFRRSGALAGLYVGLVFAYGSLAYVARGLPIEPLKQVLTGVLVASALLHFYYDGFIWKVRERSTRQSLGLKGGDDGQGGGKARAGLGLPVWAGHGLKWAALVVPIVWLGITEARTSEAAPHSDLEAARALVEALPDSADAHLDLGKALAERGRTDEAIEAYEQALEIRPDDAKAHNNLSLAWAEKGDLEREVEHLRRALAIDPDYAEAHTNMSVALAMRGDLEAAEHHAREALRLDAGDVRAHLNLGVVLASRGQREEGVAHLRRALELEPGLPEAERALSRLGVAR